MQPEEGVINLQGASVIWRGHQQPGAGISDQEGHQQLRGGVSIQ